LIGTAILSMPPHAMAMTIKPSIHKTMISAMESLLMVCLMIKKSVQNARHTIT
jgi:hypothetical protein